MNWIIVYLRVSATYRGGDADQIHRDKIATVVILSHRRIMRQNIYCNFPVFLRFNAMNFILERFNLYFACESVMVIGRMVVGPYRVSRRLGLVLVNQ